MTEPSSNAINRLTEAMIASREVTDRQLRALATTVEQTSALLSLSPENILQPLQRKTLRQNQCFRLFVRN